MSFLLNVQRLSKSFRGLRAVTNVSFEVEERRDRRSHRSQRRRQNDDFQHGRRRAPARRRSDSLRRQIDRWAAAGSGLRARHRPNLSDRKPFAGLSVLDNVIVGALRCCARVDEARAFAATIIDKLGLGAKRDFPASSLTLPDRKQLEVARALATRPKLLLLDEVMAGLRPLECDQLIAFLQEINQRDGVTILLIEHVMRAVMALAHKVIVLHHGEMIAQGSPAHVVLDAAVLECYLGEDLEL